VADSKLDLSRAGTLTDVQGLRVGHFTDLIGATGCTVVLCPEGAVAAVDVRGAAPATRETDLLRPENRVQLAHAVLLTGGSAFGLAAADGVVRYLEEQGSGFQTSVARVPIVVGAALFDLGLGSPSSRPDATAGYAACQLAGTGAVVEGNVGAGTGATVGHLLGRASAMKGGLGSASRRLSADTTVGALVAVNAFGGIVDYRDGRLIAGPRDATGRQVWTSRQIERLRERPGWPGQNTTLAVVATDASLERPALLRVAQMAHDGLARAVEPAHTGFDGDAVFALATARRPGLDSTIVGAVAAEVLAEAIVRAVLAASSLGGVPACRDAG
jgi:L-aminopeptidase/D-esterase-like protein